MGLVCLGGLCKMCNGSSKASTVRLQHPFVVALASLLDTASSALSVDVISLSESQNLELELGYSNVAGYQPFVCSAVTHQMILNCLPVLKIS
jgi:hypothetical protein